MSKNYLGPFVMVPDWVWDSDITVYAVRLALAMTKFAGQDGMAWPSLETLCKVCRMSKNSVLSARNELVAIGFLEVTPRKSERGGDITNSYKVNPISPEERAMMVERGVHVANTGGVPDVNPPCSPREHKIEPIEKDKYPDSVPNGTAEASLCASLSAVRVVAQASCSDPVPPEPEPQTEPTITQPECAQTKEPTPYAIASSVIQGAYRELGWKEATAVDVRKHLKRDDCVQTLALQFGIAGSIELFVYAARHWEHTPTWASVCDQRNQIFETMSGSRKTTLRGAPPGRGVDRQRQLAERLETMKRAEARLKTGEAIHTWH